MFGLRTFMQKNIIKKKINNTRQHHILNTICKQISTKSKEFVDNLNFSFLASGTTRGSLYGLYTRLTRTGKRAPNSEAPRSWWKTGWEVAWWERLRDVRGCVMREVAWWESSHVRRSTCTALPDAHTAPTPSPHLPLTKYRLSSWRRLRLFQQKSCI